MTREVVISLTLTLVLCSRTIQAFMILLAFSAGPVDWFRIDSICDLNQKMEDFNGSCQSHLI